jgi:hypothetical protein
VNADEYNAIGQQALLHGLDPELLRAIRVAENGWADDPAGDYMGVEDPRHTPATRADALREAAASLRDIIARIPYGTRIFEIADGQVYQGAERYRRLVFTDAALAFIRDQWAPLRAANDPHNKNANWLANLTSAHQQLAQGGLAAWEQERALA